MKFGHVRSPWPTYSVRSGNNVLNACVSVGVPEAVAKTIEIESDILFLQKRVFGFVKDRDDYIDITCYHPDYEHLFKE